LSTVTTTFLDAYSAGVSVLNIHSKLNEKITAILMAALGTVVAIVMPIEQYENFLYAIGSVFAPLFAILLTDYYLLKNRNIVESKNIYWLNTLIWVFGVWIYHQFMEIDIFLGSTFPVMVVISLSCILIKGVAVKWISFKNV
jgi:purine-cytosine permease-like protein